METTIQKTHSVCDECPGRCCTRNRWILSRVRLTHEEASSGIFNKGIQWSGLRGHGAYPYLDIDPVCPYLGKGSKCTIYENRPQACRDYLCFESTTGMEQVDNYPTHKRLLNRWKLLPGQMGVDGNMKERTGPVGPGHGIADFRCHLCGEIRKENLGWKKWFSGTCSTEGKRARFYRVSIPVTRKDEDASHFEWSPCFECDTGKYESVLVDYTTQTRDGREIVVPNVPMERCNVCGDTIIGSGGSEKIDDHVFGNPPVGLRPPRRSPSPHPQNEAPGWSLWRFLKSLFGGGDGR